MTPPRSRSKKRPPELFLKRVSIHEPEGEDLPKGYPFDIPVIQSLDERRFRSPVTVFVGENGMGKSTLLEAIAVALGFNPEGGSLNLRFSSHASHSVLHDYLRLSRGIERPRDGYFFRAESYYNLASEIDALDNDPEAGPGPRIISSYGGTSLHEQSHGESFFSLFLHRFGGLGIYLLDEPESALSPQRQLSFLVRMHDLVRGGSQFVIATHAPILMAYPGADVWWFGADGISSVESTETEHWRVTKRFLGDPDSMLRELLGE